MYIYKWYLKIATNRCVNCLLLAFFSNSTNFKATSFQFFYFMGRVLPIGILNEQEAKIDFRIGTHFSILEVVASKIQLGKLWSQADKVTWCTNNFFFRLSPNPSNSEEKQFINILGDVSQQWYFAFAQISKARNQSCSEWTCPWWTCSWWNLPIPSCWPFPSHAVPDLVFPKSWGWCPSWIMNDSICRGMSLPDWPSTLFCPSLAPATVDFPSSLHFWISKEKKLVKRSWRGAWRGLGTAQLEVGQLEAGLKFLGI